MEQISIDAQLRINTEQARKAIADVGKNQKPVTIPIKYEAGKISEDFAALTADSISKRLKVSFDTAGDDLAKKIETVFKDAKIKTSGGGLVGGLLGSLTNVVTAPLAAIARGSFEGIGREISQKLGQGIAKGIDNQAGQFIGSFEFFSENIANQFLPRISNGLIAGLKSLPLGDDIKNAIKDLDTEEGRKELKSKIAELLGDTDLLIEKEFNRGQKAESIRQKLDVAQQSVGKEFQSNLANNQNVTDAQDRLNRLGVNIAAINLVEAVADKNVAALNKLQATVSQSIGQLETDLGKAELILQDRLNKLAQATELKDLASKTGNEQIAQSATAKIATFEQDIATIRQIIIDKTFNLKSLKERLSSIPSEVKEVKDSNVGQKLEAQASVIAQVLNQNQIEVFNNLVESQINNNKKRLNNLDRQLENAIAPLKSVISTAETVDIGQLKQDQEEVAKTATGRAIAVAERIENRVKVLQEKRKQLIKISNDPDDEVVKALDLKISRYEGLAAIANDKASLSLLDNPDVKDRNQSINSRLNIIKQGEIAAKKLPEIEAKLRKIRDKAEFELKQHNEALEKLTKKVETSSQVQSNTTSQVSIFTRTADVAQVVDNPKIEKADGRGLGGFHHERLVQEQAINKVQRLVNSVAKEVEKISQRTIANIPEGVAAFDLAQGLTGAFRQSSNQIALQPSVVEAINNGNIDRNVIELIAHELRHVVQLAEGEIKDLVSGNFLLTPTPQELQKIGAGIEASTQAGTLPGFGKEEIRKIEADAYTFALRYTDQIAENVNKILVDNTEQIRDVTTKIKPIELPKTPAISSRAFPVVQSSNDLEILLNQQISASGLKEIVKRLGLGTDNPAKKVAIERIVNSYKQDALKVQELIGRLGDDIKLKSAKSGVESSLGKIDDEPALKEAFKANRQVLGEAFKKLETLSGEQREVLASQINAIALDQIEAIDRVTREFKVAGSTGQSLSGTRSQFAAIYDFETIKQQSQKLQKTLSSLGDIDATDAIKTITKIEPQVAAFLASVKTLDKTNETEQVRQQLEKQLKAIKTAKKLSLEAVEFDYQELLSNPTQYVNILKDSAIAKSKQNIQETANNAAKNIGGKVSQAVETILENTREKIGESLKQIERVALPEQQANLSLPNAKTGEITARGNSTLSTQAQVINTVSSLAIRAIADITATSKSAFEQAKALEKLVLDLNPLLKVAKTGIQTATPVLAGGALISQSPEIAQAAKFAAENLANVIQPLIAALRAGGANAVGDLVGQIPGVGGVSRAVIQGLLNNPAFNAQIAEGLANVTTVAGIGAGAIKGGKAAVSKVAQTTYKALPESLQDRLTPESITAFDTLVAQRQKEINGLARDLQEKSKVKSQKSKVDGQKLLTGYAQVTQQIEELEKFSVKAGIEVLKRTKDRIAQLKRVQNNLKNAIPEVTVEQAIKGEGSNLKNVTPGVELGGVISNRTTDIVNSIAKAVEAEIANTVIKTIGNIAKSPAGRDLGKEAAVNGIGFVAGKSASIASGGIPGIGLATEYGASAITRKAVTDIESTLDALSLVLNNGSIETKSKLQLFQQVLEAATSEARRKSSITKNDLDKDTTGFAIGNIAASVSQQVGAQIPLIGAATAIATTKPAIALRNHIIDSIDAKTIVTEVANGIKLGVSKNVAVVAAQGEKLGQHLESGFKDRLGIKSPATEFIKDMQFVALGVAIGVEHHLRTIGKSGKKLGQELINNFTQKAVQDATSATDKIINRIENNLQRADRASVQLDIRTRLENEAPGSNPLTLTQRRTQNEGNKIATEAQTLLAELKTIVTVGVDANQKLKQAQSAIAALQKERVQLLKSTNQLRGEEKLKVIAQVEQIDAQIAEEIKRAKSLSQEREEAKKLIPVYKDLTKLNQQLKSAISNGDSKNIRRLRTEIDDVYRRINRTPPLRGGLLGGIQTQLEGIGLTSQNVLRGLKGLAALAVGSLFIGGFDDVLRNAAQTRMRFEQLESQINFASGSAKEGAVNFAFATKEAQRLNIGIEQALKGYATLSAATKNSDALRGETQRIFSVISQASRVTGSTAEQTEAAFLAIQQIISGGANLQLEELRQLGESGNIKGVFNIAEKALGTTDGELKKLISTGKVAVDDFLPKFIDELDRVTRSGVAESLNTTTAAVTSVKNEFALLQNEIGKLSENTAKSALRGIAATLDLVRDNLKIIVPVLQTTAVLITAALLPSLIAIARTVGGFLLAGLQKTFTAVVALNGGLTASNAQIVLLTASTALFAAGAVVVVSQVTQAFFNLRDAGKEARNAVLGIEDAIKSLDKAQSENKVLGANNIAEANKKRLKESQNFIQNAVDGVINFRNAVNNKFNYEGSEATTYTDAAISRIEAATGEAIFANQKLLSIADNKLGLGDVTEKSTKDLQDFASALEASNTELNNTIDAAVNPEQIKQLNTELEENQKRLKLYNDELTRREGKELNLAKISIARNDAVNAATKAETEAIAAIDEQILRSGDFKKDVELDKLRFTKTRLDAELTAEKLALSQILALAQSKDAINPQTGKPRNSDQLEEYEKTEQRINELTRSSIETRQSILAKEVEQKVAEYDRYLEKVEKSRQDAEDLAIASEKERLIELQQLYNDDLINKETLEDFKAKSQKSRVKSELEQEQLKLQKLEQFRSDEQEVREKADEEIKASKNKILDLTLDLLQQEKEAEEKTIEAIAAAREKAYSALENRLSKLQQIYQTEADLISDRNASEEKLGELQLAKLRQALELRKQLNSGDLNANERRTIIRQLVSLGIEGRTDELSLLNQIEDKEKAIAKKKLDSLLVQQEFARKQLEIENDQLIIATQKAKIEAEKGQLEARKELNSAESAIAEAESAIANAETPEELAQANKELDQAVKLYNLAQESLDLADEDVKLSQQQVDKLDDIIERKQKNLELSQAIALAEVRSQESEGRSGIEKERDEARESRDRRRVERGDAPKSSLDRYLSTSEKIDQEVESRKEKVESSEGEFSESDEARLRQRRQKAEGRGQNEQESGVRRSLLGNPGFSIEASPEVIEAIKSGLKFTVPQVSPVKSPELLQLDTLGKTKGSLSEDNMILKTLQSIETKFKQPTVIQVQNDNQFVNQYDKSGSDEILRQTRSDLVDMMNTIGQNL